jgi:molybdenum cofactor cytidylyltransferase
MAIHAVIPAAGLSRRMGRPKLVLNLGGQSVIARLLNALNCDAVTSTTIVYRKSDSELHEEIQRAISSHKLNAASISAIQPDLDPPDMRASVQIALDKIRSSYKPQDNDGWLLIPADHPILESETLAELIAAWNEKQPDVLVPSHAGRGGHPTFFRWSLASTVPEIPADQGINFLTKQPQQVHRKPVASDSILCDLDTPEDYERLLSRIRLERL